MKHSLLCAALACCLLPSTSDAAVIRVASRADRAVVTVSGVIAPGDAVALAAALSDVRLARATVVLDSPGGDAAEALGMAHEVRAHGADTSVAVGARCASGCFMVFAAGATRKVGLGSTLAVHGAAEVDGSITPRILDLDEAMRQASEAYGVPDTVTRRMSVVYGRELHVLTPDELRAMHVAPRTEPRDRTPRIDDVRSVLGPTGR